MIGLTNLKEGDVVRYLHTDMLVLECHIDMIVLQYRTQRGELKVEVFFPNHFDAFFIEVNRMTDTYKGL